MRDFNRSDKSEKYVADNLTIRVSISIIDNFKLYELSHINKVASCSMRASYYMLYLSIALYHNYL